MNYLSDDTITGLGWCWAKACASLDAGLDPRTMDIAELLARAKEDLVQAVDTQGNTDAVDREVPTCMHTL